MYWNIFSCVKSFITTPFNNNIRCIEIDYSDIDTHTHFKFNNNIRCIEIEHYNFFYNNKKGLITT